MYPFRELIITALKAALGAGDAILEVYEKPEYKKELKADHSPVTEADHAAHARIIEELHGTGIPVLSEEGKQISYEERKGWQAFWLVDPLDGTKEFIKRNGDFTVNIALVIGNRSELGVLYAPLYDLMYFSVPGFGAYRREGFREAFEGLPAADTNSTLELLTGVCSPLPLHQQERPIRIVASRSHRNMLTNRYISRMRKKHADLEIISRGSALKFCMVAEGSADIYPRFGPTWEWDTGAGQAIAEAAGCKVTLEDGESPFTYNKEDLLNPFFIVTCRKP